MLVTFLATVAKCMQLSCADQNGGCVCFSIVLICVHEYVCSNAIMLCKDKERGTTVFLFQIEMRLARANNVCAVEILQQNSATQMSRSVFISFSNRLTKVQVSI